MIEESLSVDNIFVIVLIFQYFAVPAQYQHRVLFWGILGALIMRGLFIGLGAALLARFEWIIYVFGALLVDHRRAHGGEAGRGVRRRAESRREARAALPAAHRRLPRQALLRRWRTGSATRRRCCSCSCSSR